MGLGRGSCNTSERQQLTVCLSSSRWWNGWFPEILRAQHKLPLRFFFCYRWVLKNFLVEAVQKYKSHCWHISSGEVGVGSFSSWLSEAGQQREGRQLAAPLPGAQCRANFVFPREKSCFSYADQQKGCSLWPGSCWQNWPGVAWPHHLRCIVLAEWGRNQEARALGVQEGADIH